MAKTAVPKQLPPAKRLPPLPGGLVQHREGIQRCGGCQGEVISARTIDGMLVSLSPVFGERHDCAQKACYDVLQK